jgi:hypothetical protein
MDQTKLKKPAHVKEHIWRQHLNWMEVVGKQAQENIRQRERELRKAGCAKREQ